jgi:hypothetical protein
MNAVTTDEKKPPEAVVSDARAFIVPTMAQRYGLIAKLQEFDRQFQSVTVAAGSCGEMKLMHELEKRWDDYSQLIAPLSARVPAKLFE